jgi:hypothetical protein
MLRDICKAGLSCVSSQPGPEQQTGYKDLVASILAFILAIFIIAFVGKMLWNSTLVPLFTVVRPVQSCWQIVGLLILVSLFR